MGTITHNFQSAISDDPAASAAGEVLPSHWNAGHDFSLTPADVGLGFADNEVPSGTVNGSNAVFTLAHTPSGASLQLFRNGVLQRAGGVDYTLSTATITYVSAPASGDTHVAWYRY